MPVPKPERRHPVFRLGDEGPAVAEICGMLARLGLLNIDPVSADGSVDDVAGDPGDDPEDDPAGDSAASSIPRLTARFDEDCDKAVRAFQQARGLTVDGLVGVLTYRALDEARWRLGDRILIYTPAARMIGDDVTALQKRLIELGFDVSRADGDFGPDTDRAVRELQRNVGLRADGTCGPATYKALDRLARTVVGGQAAALRESESIRVSGPRLAGKVVVIDPGHGGFDRGTVANGVEEAEVVTDLAARVEGRLAATGVSVYLTRGPQGGLQERERAEFANKTRADVVLSLHADGNPNRLANGVATYYYGNGVPDGASHSVAGERLAGLIQRELVARTGLTDCRTHAKTWDILRYTRMPAVRVYIGYITNPTDAARLADDTFRDIVAEAIVVSVQRLYLPAELDSPTGVLRLAHLLA